jgi:hypothetical protein
MSDSRNPFSQPTPAHGCPHCGSAAVTSVSHVLADIAGIWREYHCPDCSRESLHPVEPRPSALRADGPATFLNTEAPTITFPWHSTLATDRPVYHDDRRCPEAGSIESMYRRPSTGGRPHCSDCARGVTGPLPFRALAGPETCPTCQSARISPAGRVITSSEGVVVRREYQCVACGGAFWVRAEGAPLNPPLDAI